MSIVLRANWRKRSSPATLLSTIVEYQSLSNTQANDPTAATTAIVDVDSAFGRRHTRYGWKPNGWLCLLTRR